MPQLPRRRLSETDHPRRAPHLDGGVVAGGQQQLLIRWAERHRIHNVVVRQPGQTDVIVSVPDVAVLVLCSTTDGDRRDTTSGGQLIIIMD